MSSTIIKMAGRQDPFARIPHTMLEDDAISWKAKGILAYIVSKPDGWKVRIGDIAKRGTDGERAIRSALDELRSAGYVELSHVREEGKIKEWVWKVSDSRIFAPDCAFADVENADVQNGYHSKKEGRKNDCRKNQSKEAKETATPIGAAAGGSFAPQWIPDSRTKTQKLRAIRPPKKMPSEVEFDRFVEEHDLGNILNYRGDLYATLCDHKWHQWKQDIGKWVPIRDWKLFVLATDNHIAPGQAKPF